MSLQPWRATAVQTLGKCDNERTSDNSLTLLFACLNVVCQFEQNERQIYSTDAQTLSTLHVTGYLVMILVMQRAALANY